ncbi:MAG: lysine--tRNA ligase [Aigarchaeota archaeon]|nr:lysine--tRNA ligase [Aigarchaeota archaeon]MCX8193351.1 lysine--tRNA ligase [Nitrososphaeria archaeon]MDW7985881.1 lysine--tRNA ligase [Nitrososphaerota archaeon]
MDRRKDEELASEAEAHRMMSIIGHGTWMDKVAYELIEREKNLGRSLDIIRTESGIGASGIPHIGSMADAVRAYGIVMALEEMGYRSELIAFSDDMDGLRKVPLGFPNELQEYLLMPVSSIPDVFGCHNSFADHVSSMLRESLDYAGIKYVFKSGRETYASGVLSEAIHKILMNAEKVGKIISELTGQEKYLKTLPYFAVCKNCGRIYTTQSYYYDLERRLVYYRCTGVEIKRRWFNGCGYEGRADITRDDGKLAWKTEFAARWSGLDIRFEAYGKDIADSVKVNDWVSKNILEYEPPMHIRYELFLDKSGKKISKSAGNVFTSQDWYKYGTPQSLLLLFFKRVVGTRIISYETIPKIMDELDYLEDVYYGRVKIENNLEREKLKGLYLYSHLLKPPSRPSSHIPYSLIVELTLMAPDDRREEFIISRLQRYGYKIGDEDLRKIKLAVNYALDFGAVVKEPVELSDNEKEAIKELIDRLLLVSSSNEIQNAIFTIARKYNIDPPEFFKKLYKIFLGREYGPRLGPYLQDMGVEKAVEILKRTIGKNNNTRLIS